MMSRRMTAGIAQSLVIASYVVASGCSSSSEEPPVSTAHDAGRDTRSAPAVASNGQPSAAVSPDQKSDASSTPPGPGDSAPPGPGPGGPEPGGPPGGPQACSMEQDCAQACPEATKGCTCAQTPQGQLCVPKCDVDSDCPKHPGVTLVCSPAKTCVTG